MMTIWLHNDDDDDGYIMWPWRQENEARNTKLIIIKHFRHIKRHQTREKLILEVKVKGQRNRGRPTRTWEKDVEEWMGLSVWRVGRTADGRLMDTRSIKAATSGNGKRK